MLKIQSVNPIIWHLFRKGYYKDTMTNNAVWLTFYVYIFAI